MRDNIHSYDVVSFIKQFISAPRSCVVYKLGGRRADSVSILEAFALISEVFGRAMKYEYLDQNPSGDHVCYFSELTKIKNHYPN